MKCIFMHIFSNILILFNLLHSIHSIYFIIYFSDTTPARSFSFFYSTNFILFLSEQIKLEVIKNQRKTTKWKVKNYHHKIKGMQNTITTQLGVCFFYCLTVPDHRVYSESKFSFSSMFQLQLPSWLRVGLCVHIPF